jgi:hypothetical protein
MLLETRSCHHEELKEDMLILSRKVRMKIKDVSFAPLISRQGARKKLIVSDLKLAPPISRQGRERNLLYPI